MTDIQSRIDELHQLYKSGVLTKETYEAAVKALSGEDAEDAAGDNTDISTEGDIAFAKDQAKSVIVKGSQSGIIGDHGRIEGNVHFHSSGEDSRDPAETLRIYCRTLIRSLRHLALRGIDTKASDPSDDNGKLELDRVYVSLDTRTQVELSDSEKKAAESDPAAFREKETRPLSVLEAVVQHRQLVVLGDPGSGKSTFLNHLTFCLAVFGVEPGACRTDWVSCWPGENPDLLPIPVVLRDFAGWLPENADGAEAGRLWDFICERLKAQNLDFTAGLIEKRLEVGKAIILLDGLDEISTPEKRGFVRDAVSAFAARYDKSRYIVTCRILSYQNPEWRLDRNAFPVFELAPFHDEKIDAFIDAWYEDLRRLKTVKTEEESAGLSRRLKDAVRRPDLWRLAPNPLLLTVMALVHTHKGRLPDARALLYEETVDILLWRWEQVKTGGGKSLPRLQELLLEAERADVDLKKALWKLAFDVHGKGDRNKNRGPADIHEWHLSKALSDLHPKKSRDWADQVIRTMKMRAGLLLEREPEIYSFPHRTFQEYLAGAYLSSQSDFAVQATKLIETGNFWREAVLLAAGRSVYLAGDSDKPLALVGELCPERAETDAVSWRKIWIAGEVLVEIGMNRVEDSRLGRDLTRRVRLRLVDLLEGGHLEAKERVAAGNALSRLDDPRFNPDMWYLPDDDMLGFVTVPAGEFLMGSDKKRDPEADDDETPRHPVHLSEFRISRYPVTVAQYRVFAEETGRKLNDAWLKYNRFDNHPVVQVTWNDASAYCKWLTKKLKDRGMTISLPTEAQWEKAARGEDGRIYPWGDEKIKPERANYSETGIGSTSPVGCFSKGDTREGVSDMIGNVWEWTCSLWGKDYKLDFKYPYDPNDGREDMSNSSDRVIRGGSWRDSSGFCRAAYRYWSLPGFRGFDLGFRLVLPGQ